MCQRQTVAACGRGDEITGSDEGGGDFAQQYTFSSLITACANAKPSALVDEAMALLERMEAAGLSPNEYTLSAILKCCARSRSPRVALAEHQFRRLIGSARLNEHVERQLCAAVGRGRAETLCQWAIREHPECVDPPIGRGGRGWSSRGLDAPSPIIN